MAIIIEDGSEIANANSYATSAAFVAWAALRNYTIVDDSTAEGYLIKAFDFIKGLEGCLRGTLVTKTQTGAYPRNSLVISGFSWDNDEIPQIVKDYQMSLALDINNGIDIHNPKASAATPVKRVKVEGAVEKEFAVADAQQISYQSLSNDLRSQLCHNTGMGFSISMG